MWQAAQLQLSARLPKPLNCWCCRRCGQGVAGEMLLTAMSRHSAEA